jgi:hypothetical protein
MKKSNLLTIFKTVMVLSVIIITGIYLRNKNILQETLHSIYYLFYLLFILFIIF